MLLPAAWVTVAQRTEVRPIVRRRMDSADPITLLRFDIKNYYMSGKATKVILKY